MEGDGRSPSKGVFDRFSLSLVEVFKIFLFFTHEDLTWKKVWVCLVLCTLSKNPKFKDTVFEQATERLEAHRLE